MDKCGLVICLDSQNCLLTYLLLLLSWLASIVYYYCALKVRLKRWSLAHSEFEIPITARPGFGL